MTDAIQEWVIKVAELPVDTSGQVPEFCIIELGGTIGDIESMPFVEAFRQLQYRVGTKNFCCVHVSLVPNLSSVGEPKTKPTQVCTFAFFHFISFLLYFLCPFDFNVCILVIFT